MHLEQIFYALIVSVNLVLSIRTLHFLISKWIRQYYLLGVHLILVLFMTVPAFASYVSLGNWRLESAQRMYWTVSAIDELTILLLLLQLIYRVGRELPAQAALVRFICLMAVIAIAISITCHLDKRLNSFMGAVTRDLTFCCAIINMVLWRFLLQLRKRDYLLLAVSAGIGILCTGDAIGLSFRFVSGGTGQSRGLLEFGNVVMALSSVMTFMIWHTAFSRSRDRKVPLPAAPEQPDPPNRRTELVESRESR